MTAHDEMLDGMVREWCAKRRAGEPTHLDPELDRLLRYKSPIGAAVRSAFEPGFVPLRTRLRDALQPFDVDVNTAWIVSHICSVVPDDLVMLRVPTPEQVAERERKTQAHERFCKARRDFRRGRRRMERMEAAGF